MTMLPSLNVHCLRKLIPYWEMLASMSCGSQWNMRKRLQLLSKMLNIGLACARGHPILVQCLEILLECMREQNLDTQEVITVDDRVVERLDPISITIVLKLSMRDQYTDADKEHVERYLFYNKTQCLNAIARNWLLTPRKGISHLSGLIHMSFLEEDIINMVIFFRNLMGNKDS